MGINPDDYEDETNEDRTRRYARNRYEMRMKFKWRLSDTDKDDWESAKKQVEDDNRRKNG